MVEEKTRRDVAETPDKKGITGSTIKIIACMAMFIDHVGAGILERYLERAEIDMLSPLGLIDLVLRLIGRMAFPIFIYLMVEGMRYTKNKWKYLLRMVIFAAVSEIPFDMLFNLSLEDIKVGKILEFGYQNVYFTLALGLYTIIAIDICLKSELKKPAKIIINILITGLTMAFAQVLETDYGAFGVLAIVVAYLLREDRIKEFVWMVVALILASPMELVALIDLAFIKNYNGKRGINLKWLFYAFYPVHILIILAIRILILKF